MPGIVPNSYQKSVIRHPTPSKVARRIIQQNVKDSARFRMAGLTENHGVGGSIPSLATNLRSRSQAKADPTPRTRASVGKPYDAFVSI